jgi:hypothetical protein
MTSSAGCWTRYSPAFPRRAAGPDELAGPGQLRPEPRVLARAVLDGLRLLSRDEPVLVAVDDAQWLDRPSAAVRPG